MSNSNIPASPSANASVNPNPNTSRPWANEKRPSTLSAVNLSDIKQAREAYASSQYGTQSSRNVRDNDLAEFLANLGATLFASAGFRKDRHEMPSLVPIEDQIVCPKTKTPVQHVYPPRRKTVAVSVPSHVVRKQEPIAAQRQRKGTVKDAETRPVRKKAKLKPEGSSIEFQMNTTGPMRILRERELFRQSLRKLVRADDMLSSQKESVRILVIGAGLAGLSAVDELFFLGFKNILLLEAQDRIGGRIHTMSVGDPTPTSIVEMGVNGLDHAGEQNSAHALVNRFGLREGHVTSDSNEITSFFAPERSAPTRTEVLPYAALPAQLMLQDQRLFYSLIKSSSQENINLAHKDYLRERYNRLAQDQDGSGCCRTVSITYGPNRLSFFSQYRLPDNNNDLAVHLQAFHRDPGGPKVILPDGMSSLTRNLLARLGADRVLLNTCVERIDWQKDSKSQPDINCQVWCTGGRCFQAKHVIVTVPLGHLHEHADRMFSPQLPPSKSSALRRIGFGTMTKIFLCYATPISRKPVDFIWLGIKGALEELRSHTIRFVSRAYHLAILEVRILGSFAETMPEDDLVKQLTTIMRPRLGKQILTPVKVLRSDWFANPFFRGTHPYLSTDCTEEDLFLVKEPLMVKGQPVVLFAGDYTHHNYSCLTHAARVSGLREAHRLHKFYDTFHAFHNSNP